MYEPEIYIDLPHLSDYSNHAVTSPKDDLYNCIAWAANDPDAWWWPSANWAVVYWPMSVPRLVTVDAFVEAFATLGYQPCSDGDLQSGLEKVVLYVDANVVPTHMARQLPSGEWTSKVGSWHDIMHVTVDVVAGGAYGKVHQFLARPIPTTP